MKLLDTNASNTKIAKSQKESGFRIASLSLYPDDLICPAALLANCKAPCLVEAGFGNLTMSDKGALPKRNFIIMTKKHLWHNCGGKFIIC
jgi:hypothetical protein